MPALSHALPGPSDVRGGALHGPSAEDVTIRSCSGGIGEPPSPLAALHPATMDATATATVRRAKDRVRMSSVWYELLGFEGGLGRVDVVVGSLMTGVPDETVDNPIPLRGVTPPVVRLHPPVDHIADKRSAGHLPWGGS